MMAAREHPISRAELGRLIVEAKEIVHLGMPTLAKQRMAGPRIAYLFAHISSAAFALLERGVPTFLDARRTTFLFPSRTPRGRRMGGRFSNWVANVTRRECVDGAESIPAGAICVVVFAGDEYRVLAVPYGRNRQSFARCW